LGETQTFEIKFVDFNRIMVGFPETDVRSSKMSQALAACLSKKNPQKTEVRIPKECAAVTNPTGSLSSKRRRPALYSKCP